MHRHTYSDADRDAAAHRYIHDYAYIYSIFHPGFRWRHSGDTFPDANGFPYRDADQHAIGIAHRHGDSVLHAHQYPD